MAVVPISVKFEEERTILLYVCTSPLHGLTDHQNILSIYMYTWNQITSCVKLGVVRATFCASAHTVFVVFTNVNHRKFVKACDVSSLEELALVCSTITVHRASKSILAFILHRKCKTGADGHLSADNTISTEETLFAVVVMH